MCSLPTQLRKATCGERSQKGKEKDQGFDISNILAIPDPPAEQPTIPGITRQVQGFAPKVACKGHDILLTWLPLAPAHLMT